MSDKRRLRSVIVTGAKGFIGFNALRLFRARFPDLRLAATDADTYADRFMAAEKDEWLANKGIPHEIIDFSKNDAVDRLTRMAKNFGADAILHYGAESHVDNSIKDPGVFFRSNMIGTANVLETARRLGIRVHVVSTDEVYGVTRPEDGCFEGYGLSPSSPYSSSKASADLIALSYARTFGLDVTVSRCSNNFGPWQMTEKLFPSVVKKALAGEDIPVYGDGRQKRHWIHVDEHNLHVFDILQNAPSGSVCNIAPPPENYVSNMRLIEMILERLGRPLSLVKHVADRPGHDTSYYINSGTGHSSSARLEDELGPTVEWYAERFSK